MKQEIRESKRHNCVCLGRRSIDMFISTLKPICSRLIAIDIHFDVHFLTGHMIWSLSLNLQYMIPVEFQYNKRTAEGFIVHCCLKADRIYQNTHV